MDVLKAGFDGLCDFFIRPPRNEYDIEDLGPKDFVIRGKRVLREDFQLTNPRNMTLQCSFYKPQGNPENAKLPCVIYIHGNSGSRMDAIDCVPVLLPNNICLFSFDAAGSGFSEGSYVSLGFYEKFDVQAIVDYLRSTNKISRIGLHPGPPFPSPLPNADDIHLSCSVVGQEHGSCDIHHVHRALSSF